MSGTKSISADLFEETALKGGAMSIPTTNIKLWIDPNNGKFLGKYDEYEIKNEYFAHRNELVRQNTDAGMEKSVAWKCAYKQLWGEYGCCYYPCSHLVLNALQEDIDEMLEGVTEICVLDEED